jgi:hypothetical protein
MTLGIAIPSYKEHIPYLYVLLDQISKSTILPEQVSVSISSFDGELELKDYPYELIITKTSDFKNTSQNRNVAGSKLTTDIISFIDSDDLPHIKRNEYLLESIKQGSKIIVHNYEMGIHPNTVCDNPIGGLILYQEYVDTYFGERNYPQSSKGHQDYHNAHITLIRSIFDEFKYNEDQTFFKCEDSVYTSLLVNNGLNICYIQNKLSYYRH